MRTNSNISYSGAQLSKASAVMICIHGRGADAEDILSLAEALDIEGVAFIAPQAENNTWYPYSFLEPVERNEPFLSAGILRIRDITEDLSGKGFKPDDIYYLGFSQGACLILEFAARFPKQYGGIFALSGALIGKEGGSFDYEGQFYDTPVFLGCSDTDPHIPLDRITKTEELLLKMNARVTKRIYPDLGHTVNKDELNFIRDSIKLKLLS